jgi:hypothetical protein
MLLLVAMGQRISFIPCCLVKLAKVPEFHLRYQACRSALKEVLLVLLRGNVALLLNQGAQQMEFILLQSDAQEWVLSGDFFIVPRACRSAGPGFRLYWLLFKREPFWPAVSFSGY